MCKDILYLYPCCAGKYRGETHLCERAEAGRKCTKSKEQKITDEVLFCAKCEEDGEKDGEKDGNCRIL
jgi:hypothetical protein